MLCSVEILIYGNIFNFKGVNNNNLEIIKEMGTEKMVNICNESEVKMRVNWEAKKLSDTKYKKWEIEK